jgi:hypothetical protein
MRSWIARRILRKMAERYAYDVSYLENDAEGVTGCLLQVRACHEGVRPS